jgi:hypothetical protein
MPPKVFREFSNARVRERWPLELDLGGVERDSEIRKLKVEENMGKSLQNNFVSGKAIDINKPAQVAYDPRQHQYPKMIYHQTKKDPNWLAEHKRLTLYNSLHPEKPELLPNVPYAFTIAKTEEDEKRLLATGEWGLRAPHQPEQDEFANLRDEALCSRGCGNPPHRGSCKPVAVSA